MKRLIIVLVGLLELSCQSLSVDELQKGKLSFYLDFPGGEVVAKGVDEAPDTNSFYLSVVSSSGRVYYEGLYGQRPKSLTVDYGEYRLSLLSTTNLEPSFSNPCFGDIKQIMIDSAADTLIVFNCKQMNSGIKFTFAESFRNRFPGSGITLRDNNSKVLFYAYNERRYAYFMPGTIDLLYTKSNGEDTLLLRREIVEKQMLTLNLSYSPLHKDISSFIRIGLDTTRYWNNKDYNIGISLPQGTLSVAEAKAAVGEKGVMVFGYIVGTDATANSIRVGPPFSSDTYIIIGDSRSDFNSERLMAVELPSKSQIREDLNLVSHPELVGAAVILTGDIVESYQSLGSGLKNTKAYTLLE